MITYRYDAYGNTTKSNNTLNNPYQYNAEYTDSSTGLQYLRARYYDSSQGRFTAKDTYLGTIPNPLSRNLYTYVENNPLNYIDPSGHVKVGKSIGASAANIARVTADAASIAKKTVSVASKGANYVAVANSPTATSAAKAKAKATYLQSKAGLAVALAMKKACSVTDRAKDDGTTKAELFIDTGRKMFGDIIGIKNDSKLPSGFVGEYGLAEYRMFYGDLSYTLYYGDAKSFENYRRALLDENDELYNKITGTSLINIGETEYLNADGTLKKSMFDTVHGLAFNEIDNKSDYSYFSDFVDLLPAPVALYLKLAGVMPLLELYYNNEWTYQQVEKMISESDQEYYGYYIIDRGTENIYSGSY
ncbi:MAG: RHS repeat-associated core domain-containing protein [Eubacterium sp.]|nr:RHS repeat-associated core domain-containing protein [Eubacterium sp.]